LRKDQCSHVIDGTINLGARNRGAALNNFCIKLTRWQEDQLAMLSMQSVL